MTDAIEKAVREYPEQWFWVHRRWRKYYPHLYTEEIDWRRRSRDRKKRGLNRLEAENFVSKIKT